MTNDEQKLVRTKPFGQKTKTYIYSVS